MYVSSRQGYKPPVKSIGKVKEYTHFASLKYCNGAETFYTYDPQRRRLQNLTVNSVETPSWITPTLTMPIPNI